MADLIALLLATITGLLTPGVKAPQLEKQMQAAVLKEKPVPMESIAVKCKGVSAGGVDELTFTFTGLLLDPLLIKDANMKIGSVKPVKGGKVSLKSIAWFARIGDKELTAALNAHAESLTNATVLLDPEGITLKGKYKTWLGKMPFEVKGNLVVENDTQLVFEIDKSRMTGIPVPKTVNKIIEKEVNPVYDLAKFAERSKKDIELAKKKLNYDFKLRIDKMVPKDGILEVTGTA